MEDLAYIAHEIGKGRNLPLNLKRYESGMRLLYGTLGMIKLSMNAWTVYKEDTDGEEESRPEENARCLAAKEELARLIRSGINGEDCLAPAEALRDSLVQEMEILTSFTDNFRVFEYVLNRVEYRFKDEVLDEKYYGYYLTNDLIHYIFQTKDNVAVNERIREVITQLPMRMSRQHFFETLDDAFTLYRGAQKGTIDDFADMLKDSGTLSLPEGAEEHFPDFSEALTRLMEADYHNITKDAYEELSHILADTSEKITDVSDAFVLLAQMTNDACTILFSRTLADGADLGEDAFARNLRETYRWAEDILKRLMDPETADTVSEDDFKPLEGMQERILMILGSADFAVDLALKDKEAQLEEMGALTEFQNLKACGKLQSGSDFVSLHESPERLDVPDNSYADEVCAGVKKALKEQFIAVSQPVRRALMASVLSQLPVLFADTDALQSYINVSLEQCSDTAERLATVELLKEIMGHEVG